MTDVPGMRRIHRSLDDAFEVVEELALGPGRGRYRSSRWRGRLGERRPCVRVLELVEELIQNSFCESRTASALAPLGSTNPASGNSERSMPPVSAHGNLAHWVVGAAPAYQIVSSVLFNPYPRSGLDSPLGSLAECDFAPPAAPRRWFATVAITSTAIGCPQICELRSATTSEDGIDACLSFGSTATVPADQHACQLSSPFLQTSLKPISL